MATGSAKALVKGLALVDVVAANPGGLRLADLVQASGTPKATLLRLLEALVNAHVLSVDAHGVYRLGPQCVAWGAAYLASVDLRGAAADVLARLADTSGETCHLGILDGLRVLYLDKVDSPHAVRMVSRIGSRSPLYCTALGKAMLARLDEATFDEVVAAGLEPRTDNTITDVELLLRDLAQTRRRGYAVDDVENEEGVRCVGSAIFDDTGRVVAAISVAGPAFRMGRQRIEQLGPDVREAAEEVSRRLGYSRTGARAGHGAAH